MFNKNLYNLFKTFRSSKMKRGPPKLKNFFFFKKKEFLKNKTQNKKHSYPPSLEGLEKQNQQIQKNNE